jgi:glutamate racemase
MKTSEAPIGVFDSGIGGLTVVRELLRIMPEEGIIYLGDTARVPYGIRSPETVIRYSLESTGFLLSKMIKLLVVACNTASAVGLESIRESSSVPVVGVIQPGARAAVRGTRNKRIGIIGTDATVRSDSYLRAIRGFDREIEVFSIACPLFVPIVEEGWLEGDVPLLTASRYLGGFSEKGIDTLVLGCTHYPLLKPVISKVMDGVSLIDSATETADEVRHILEREGLRRAPGGEPSMAFYVTDSPERFKTVGERFLGRRIENIKQTDLEVRQ